MRSGFVIDAPHKTERNEYNKMKIDLDFLQTGRSE
jgi:hypothetical protein